MRPEPSEHRVEVFLLGCRCFFIEFVWCVCVCFFSLCGVCLLFFFFFGGGKFGKGSFFAIVFCLGRGFLYDFRMMFLGFKAFF